MDTEGRDANASSTVVIYTVTHRTGGDRWSAAVSIHLTGSDGVTVPLGELRRAFGPFDDHVSVAQWMCQQVHAYTKSQATTSNSPPDDPPQGRRLPDA